MDSKSSGLKISGVPVFGSVIPWLCDVFKLFSLSGLPFSTYKIIFMVLFSTMFLNLHIISIDHQNKIGQELYSLFY